MTEFALPSVGMQSYACAIHGPITFPGSKPHNDHKQGLNDFVKALINTEAVQRLRWIRQNGLCHFVFRDFQRINYSKKNKRQVFSRMIIILRGEKRGCRGQPLFSPSSMHEKYIHLSSALKLNSVKLVCFVAK
jgi:hypothetical protein